MGGNDPKNVQGVINQRGREGQGRRQGAGAGGGAGRRCGKGDIGCDTETSTAGDMSFNYWYKEDALRSLVSLARL